MTTLSVDLTDPEVAAAFADCKPGEEKTFNGVVATLKSKSDKTAEFEVSDLGEYGGESETPEEDAADTTEEEAPVAGKNPAVEAVKKGY